MTSLSFAGLSAGVLSSDKRLKTQQPLSQGLPFQLPAFSVSDRFERIAKPSTPPATHFSGYYEGGQYFHNNGKACDRHCTCPTAQAKRTERGKERESDRIESTFAQLDTVLQHEHSQILRRGRQLATEKKDPKYPANAVALAEFCGIYKKRNESENAYLERIAHIVSTDNTTLELEWRFRQRDARPEDAGQVELETTQEKLLKTKLPLFANTLREARQTTETPRPKPVESRRRERQPVETEESHHRDREKEDESDASYTSIRRTVITTTYRRPKKRWILW